MPTKTTTDVTPKTPAEDMTQTLHSILAHLERMDKRDRLRTWGGFVRGMLALIPLVFFIVSTIYIYENLDSILKTIATQAAQSAAEASKNTSAEFLKSMQNMVKQ